MIRVCVHLASTIALYKLQVTTTVLHTTTVAHLSLSGEYRSATCTSPKEHNSYSNCYNHIMHNILCIECDVISLSTMCMRN